MLYRAISSCHHTIGMHRLPNLPAAVEIMTFIDTKNGEYFCNGYDSNEKVSPFLGQSW